MFRPWLIAFAIIAPVFLAGALLVGGVETQTEKSTGVVSPTKAAEKAERERKLAIATESAKQLLLAMDTDHSGELDVKELLQSRMRVHPAVGK